MKAMVSTTANRSISDMVHFRTMPANAWADIYTGFGPEAAAHGETAPPGSSNSLEDLRLKAQQVLLQAAASGELQRQLQTKATDSSPVADCLLHEFQVIDDDGCAPEGPPDGIGRYVELICPDSPGDDGAEENCDEPEADDDMSTQHGQPSASHNSGSIAWRKLSAASSQVREAVRHRAPQAGLPKTFRSIPMQAQKARNQVHKGAGYMKEHGETTLQMLAQKSESARRMPSQMSESAQRSIGYAKEKAQVVSAAVTSRVSHTTQKGIDMAMSMRPSQQGGVQRGGA
jgi:hypothetical protein